jgi:hypothetical protein
MERGVCTLRKSPSISLRRRRRSCASPHSLRARTDFCGSFAVARVVHVEGMGRDRLKHSFSPLGILAEDFRLPKRLPLIHVAWADGKMGDVKKENIHPMGVTP